MYRFLTIPWNPRVPVYEAEGEGEKGGDKDPSPEHQAALDKIATLEGDLTSAKEGAVTLEEEIAAITTRADLTKTERDEQAVKLKEIRGKYTSAEEMAAEERKKVTAEKDVTIDELTGERDSWKGRYIKSGIRREITTEAVKNKARNSRLVIAAINEDMNPTYIPVTNDDGDPILVKGEPTFQGRAKYPSLDKKGKPTILDLSIPETIKKMTEDEEYLDLFEGDGVGGVGGSSNKSKKTSTDNLAELARTDTAAFREVMAKEFGHSG